MILVRCASQLCGNEYFVFPSDFKRGFRKYCSQRCAANSFWNSEKGSLEKLKRTKPKKPKVGKETLRRYEVQGYISLSGMWGHPLASTKIGVLQEHRLVLWNKLGCLTIDCEHECHWCGKLIFWGGNSGIVSDHLDQDTKNNDPSNLVPSCNKCNTIR